MVSEYVCWFGLMTIGLVMPLGSILFWFGVIVIVPAPDRSSPSRRRPGWPRCC